MKVLRNRMILALVGLFLHLNGFSVLPGTASNDVSLGSRVMDTISEAVYEVVVLKPTKDSLQYEKPLPMDLMLYSIRTDKYYSVGTAFATLTMANNLLGIAAGPLVTGLLADQLGLAKAFQLVPLISVAAAAVFYFAKRHYLADVQRVERLHVPCGVAASA